MSVETEIERLQAQVANTATEDEKRHLSRIKGQMMQTLVDLADCRVLLEALHNSYKVSQDSGVIAASHESNVSQLKLNLQSLYEDLYKKKDDLNNAKAEKENLENQLRIVENNQEALQASLLKLKTKNETHRVRSSGAESELLQLKRRIADEDGKYKEMLKTAQAEVDTLEAQREASNAELQSMVEEAKRELHELQKFVAKQALAASSSTATPVARRRVNRPVASGSPFVTSYGPTPTRGGLFAGRHSALSVGFGWDSRESTTPLQINISNFLMSEQKQRDEDDSRIELEALYAELEEEIFKLASDDWMYPSTTYLN